MEHFFNLTFLKKMKCGGLFFYFFLLKVCTKVHSENGKLPILDVRRSAIAWWNGLASLRKTQLCDTNTELVGKVRRWETLTGREIQMIYEAEHFA